MTKHTARRQSRRWALAKEGHTMQRRWNAALQSLVLVRLGQELGTDSPAARALHDLLEVLASVAGILTR